MVDLTKSHWQTSEEGAWTVTYGDTDQIFDVQQLVLFKDEPSAQAWADTFNNAYHEKTITPRFVPFSILVPTAT